MIRTEIPHQIPSQTQALFMNTRRAVFKERALRQALGEMFDFEWTNRALFSNSYLRSRSYYPNSEFAASGVPEEPGMAVPVAVPQAIAGAVVQTAVQPADHRGARHSP